MKALSTAVSSQNIQELTQACNEAEGVGVDCTEARGSLAQLIDQQLSSALISLDIEELTVACEQAERLGEAP